MKKIMRRIKRSNVKKKKILGKTQMKNLKISMNNKEKMKIRKEEEKKRRKMKI